MVVKIQSPASHSWHHLAFDLLLCFLIDTCLIL
nr:MAG TPA: hypothetical protein [Bacteriophage sp.]